MDYLDTSYTWTEHVEKTSEKILERLGLLRRSKRFLTSGARVMFYNALVQPVMDYGVCIWGYSFISHSNTLLRLQKRAVRDAPFTALLSELNVLPFQERVAKLKQSGFLRHYDAGSAAQLHCRAVLKIQRSLFQGNKKQ